MKLNKWIIFTVVLSVLGTALIYPYLPDQIPAHWNFKGEIDRYQAKPWVFFMAILPIILYFLMVYLPKIDPKKESYEKHKNSYKIIQKIMVYLMIGIHWIAILAALGYDIDVGFLVRIMVGIVFIVTGNYSTQIRQNYFFGIKTPWALANEQVWRKTQRIGGYSFLLMGITMILTAFLPNTLSWIVMIGTIFGGIGFIYIYSYLIYKKIANQ